MTPLSSHFLDRRKLELLGRQAQSIAAYYYVASGSDDDAHGAIWG